MQVLQVTHPTVNVANPSSEIYLSVSHTTNHPRVIQQNRKISEACHGESDCQRLRSAVLMSLHVFFWWADLHHSVVFCCCWCPRESITACGYDQVTTAPQTVPLKSARMETRTGWNSPITRCHSSLHAKWWKKPSEVELNLQELYIWFCHIPSGPVVGKHPVNNRSTRSSLEWSLEPDPWSPPCHHQSVGWWYLNVDSALAMESATLCHMRCRHSHHPARLNCVKELGSGSPEVLSTMSWSVAFIHRLAAMLSSPAMIRKNFLSICAHLGPF